MESVDRSAPAKPSSELWGYWVPEPSILVGPQTDDHDYNFKLKHAKEFLGDGDKVRAYVFFKGRSILFKEQGEVLLLRFANDLEDYAKVDQMPVLEGKRMTDVTKRGRREEDIEVLGKSELTVAASCPGESSGSRSRERGICGCVRQCGFWCVGQGGRRW